LPIRYHRDGRKMKTRREDSARTRERLIAAASEVFSEKDYNVATIADICDRAGVNIAAVNYHFGDKEALYREAWRNSFRASLEAHPAHVSEEAPPDERLRRLIEALLHRVSDERNRGFLIVQRELANPTGLLEEVMETEILPIHLRMEAVVRELLGAGSSETDLQFCTVSIVNQCMSPTLARRSGGFRGGRDSSFPPRIDDIDAYADHVVRFSLGGIRAILSGRGET
jgi:TetR/AcrR family transcriptional regulator, regulator of cefoperazone and chloramphenicol sensitivity